MFQEVNIMRNIFLHILAICTMSLLLSPTMILAQSTVVLENQYDLAGQRTAETQYFIMESKLTTYALNGTRTGTDVFRLHPEIRASRKW